MLIATQISSYLIPKDIWDNSHPKFPDLPEIARPAQDALEIEKRSSNGVNLRNENHRYTLCCERIQDITLTLAQESGIFPSFHVWPAYSENVNSATSAAYLALIQVLSSTTNSKMREIVNKLRLTATFFPPSNISALSDNFSNLPKKESLFQRAAAKASKTSKISETQCESVFYKRCEILARANTLNCGIVDTIELVTT